MNFADCNLLGNAPFNVDSQFQQKYKYHSTNELVFNSFSL